MRSIFELVKTKWQHNNNNNERKKNELKKNRIAVIAVNSNRGWDDQRAWRAFSSIRQMRLIGSECVIPVWRSSTESRQRVQFDFPQCNYRTLSHDNSMLYATLGSDIPTSYMCSFYKMVHFTIQIDLLLCVCVCVFVFCLILLLLLLLA